MPHIVVSDIVLSVFTDNIIIVLEALVRQTATKFKSLFFLVEIMVGLERGSYFISICM